MFLDIQEQIKNQKLSDYDCIKYTKFQTHQLKDIIWI